MISYSLIFICRVHSKGVVEVSPKPHADVLGMLYACLAGIMLHQLASQYESRSETTAKVSVPFYIRSKMVLTEQCGLVESTSVLLTSCDVQ